MDRSKMELVYFDFIISHNEKICGLMKVNHRKEITNALLPYPMSISEFKKWVAELPDNWVAELPDNSVDISPEGRFTNFPTNTGGEHYT